MAREKEFFRTNLARLDEKYPDREMFTWAQAAKIAGLDVRTLKKYYQKTMSLRFQKHVWQVF